jgi:hypothetical protein
MGDGRWEIVRKGGSGEIAVAGCSMLDEGKAEKIGDRSCAGLPGEFGDRETPMEGRMTFCARVIRLLPAAATKAKRGGDGRWEMAVGGA